MKICVVTAQYGNFWSGLGTYATNLVHGLAAAGHDVAVLCPSPDHSKAPAGVRFLDSSDITVAPHLSNWMQLAWQAGKAVRRALAREPFDVVHFADAREALFCRSREALVVGTMNDYYFVEASGNPFHYRRYYSDWALRWLFYNVSRLVERRAILGLPLVLGNTDYVSDSLVRHYGASRERVHTVHIGLGTMAPAAAARLEGTPSVLFVGSNFERKGLPTLLRAMAQVVQRHPQALLHVIGKDPKQAQFEQSVAAAGLAGNVRFYGGVDNDRVQTLYGAADMFVMPSLIEGFGLVFLEAMAAGTPVIGGLCGGTPELITDGENGFVVTPGEATQLAGRILQLAGDAALRQRFAAAGKTTHARFSIDAMTALTVGLYRRFRVSPPA